ncbi:MAG: membrane protein insertion efficiency factor YidD [Planctomycetaceae bacterium]|nr:membrane protein insertion efficiency factor YidD [Planctomycetaceae bacterium]
MSLPDPTRPVLVRLLQGVVQLPARNLIALVRGYQWLLSPIFGGQCRFHPSCSQYFILAVEKYGAVSGSCRGIWRILRCHPFCPGGYDPP